MDTAIFLTCLACGIACPTLAIAYLRNILARVLTHACHSDASAEFWIRCATLLAITGSVLLLMLFGDFAPATALADAVRRTLLLTAGAVFASVAIISRNVWNAVRPPFPLTPADIAAAVVKERP